MPVLKDYENQGLHILVCGTCLTHFDLLDQKQVGETTNMLDIVTAMQLADKVISMRGNRKTVGKRMHIDKP